MILIFPTLKCKLTQLGRMKVAFIEAKKKKEFKNLDKDVHFLTIPNMIKISSLNKKQFN